MNIKNLLLIGLIYICSTPLCVGKYLVASPYILRIDVLMGRSKKIVFCILILASSLIWPKSSVIAQEIQYPTTILKSRYLKVNVLLPDEKNGYYRSTRFDWSGIICQVQYRGHTFFQEWEKYDGTINLGVHDPLNNGTATGTAEEFRNPLGYDEAKIGEPFVKIGVGILEKAENKPHHWAFPYKVIEYGKWKINSDEDHISFVQDLNTQFGYGYQYEKHIVLSKNTPEITVVHTLKNTGNKEINTNPYCHNFFCFDNQFIGKDYKIEFSNRIEAKNDFGTKATVSNNYFYLNNDLSDADPVQGAINANQSKVFTLSNSKTSTSVEITSEVAPDSLYLYIWRMAFCPEPMILINIKPGESFTWATVYNFKI